MSLIVSLRSCVYIKFQYNILELITYSENHAPLPQYCITSHIFIIIQYIEIDRNDNLILTLY